METIPVTVPDRGGVRVEENQFVGGDPEEISEIGQPEVIVVRYPLKPRHSRG